MRESERERQWKEDKEKERDVYFFDNLIYADSEGERE